jgi:hypothetical protein
MQQELLLNIIPFDPPTGKQKFAFYKQKQADFYPVFKDDLQGLLGDELSGLKRNNSSPAGKIITTNPAHTFTNFTSGSVWHKISIEYLKNPSPKDMPAVNRI